MAWCVDGTELRRQLVIRGLSGADLARLARVSAPTVSQAVNGRPISPRTLKAIAAVLEGVPVLPGTVGLIGAATAEERLELPALHASTGQSAEHPSQRDGAMPGVTGAATSPASRRSRASADRAEKRR